MAAHRLMMELKEIRKAQKGGKSEGGVLLLPKSEASLFEWTAYIQGPSETPFHNGTFELKIVVPQNYPLRPPKISFVTKIFHPNIHFQTGEICLDILKDQDWSAVWTLHSACLAITALLACPNQDSPLNCDAGNLLRAGDTRGYYSLARMYCIEHAGGKPAFLPTAAK